MQGMIVSTVNIKKRAALTRSYRRLTFSSILSIAIAIAAAIAVAVAVAVAVAFAFAVAIAFAARYDTIYYTLYPIYSGVALRNSGDLRC